MTPEQQAHLVSILREFETRTSDKYEAGARKYNGNIWEGYTVLELVDHAIEEAIDEFVYLVTLRQKLTQD